MSRYVPFLPPQWLPIGGNTAADFFSKAQFGIVSVLRFVGVTGPIFYRPVLHKQHLRGFFLLWEQTVSGYVSLHSSRLPFKAQFGSVDILVGQEDVQAHFGSFKASTMLCLYWGLL